MRNGHLPEREIMTGIGPVAVRCRRMRDLVGPIDGTTNVIENAFATIRHRTVRSKGRLSKQDRARHDLQTRWGRRESWRRLDGHNQLSKVILGVKFTDGVEIKSEAQASAT